MIISGRNTTSSYRSNTFASPVENKLIPDAITVRLGDRT